LLNDRTIENSLITSGSVKEDVGSSSTITFALYETAFAISTICRCETVTEAEIVEAIRRPAGARTVDGVKRRVRPGTGRCQGGFCTPRVLETLSRELQLPMENIAKSDKGTEIILGRLKNTAESEDRSGNSSKS